MDYGIGDGLTDPSQSRTARGDGFPRNVQSEASSQNASGSDSAAHERFRENRHFGSLDGLRALSILAVIGLHCNLANSSLFHTGEYGVALFFAISGFLITTLLLRESDRTGSISIRDFYIRRALRIFPLYYGVLILYVVLSFVVARHTEAGREFFADLPFFLTYTSNWFVVLSLTHHTIFYFAWSLAKEEQFYLVWAPVMTVSRNRLQPVLVIAGIMLANLLLHTADDLGWIHLTDLTLRMIDSLPPTICIGSLLAFVLNSRRGFNTVWPVLGRRWFAPAALALVVLTVQYSDSQIVIALTMAALVGTVCIREDNGLRPLLAHPVICHIGMVSYGVYLLQMLAINVTSRLHHAHDWTFFFLATFLSVAVSTLSYYYYEMRFLRLKGRFTRKARLPVAAAANDDAPVGAVSKIADRHIWRQREGEPEPQEPAANR